jgi:hypothetical protein
MKNKIDEQLKKDVVAHLTESGGKESISYLAGLLRDKGWKGLGHLRNFESTLENLGLKIVYHYSKKNPNCVRMTTVEIPKEKGNEASVV